MWRTLAILALAVHTLVATGVVDLDAFVHHEPHPGCGESAPQHHDDGHVHATGCCAHRHVAVAPIAPPRFAPPPVSRVVLEVVSARGRPFHHDLFRPPRPASPRA